jgi:ubiquitin C-terminal hydrolase
LDNFHEALNVKNEYTEIQSNDMRIMAKNGWDSFVAKNTSPIVDTFFGMIRKTIECQACKNKTYRWEVFNSLKIPCEGQTFREWIQNEYKPDSIEGYACDKCNTKSTANILTHLWKLPSNLFVTLRRFNYDGRKNISNCPYNVEVIDFRDLFAEESDDPS